LANRLRFGRFKRFVLDRQTFVRNNVKKEKHMSQIVTEGDSMAQQNKQDLLKETTAQIEKKFGKGSLMRLGESAEKLNVEAIPTGALPLDIALGVGGVPRGRIVEIYGPESSGKTTLALQILAEAQALGGIVAFIDAEHALDPVYAARLGVDIDQLLISQPDTGEQALEICDMLVRSGAIDCVIVDSVAALVPRAELEGEMGDASVGLQARLMSQALRKLTGSISKSNTTCIFINQLREKIGVMFGNPETTTGGRALKFFSSVRIDIRRTETIKVNGEPVGNRVRAKVVKNKVAPPFKQAEFDLMYGEGFSREGCILDMAAECGVVRKSGAWYNYGEDRLGQGREFVKTHLREHPDLRDEIEAKVREFYDVPMPGGAPKTGVESSTTAKKVSAATEEATAV
jgi:recombination protein RecA